MKPLLGHCRQFLWRGGSLIGLLGEEVYFLGLGTCFFFFRFWGGNIQCLDSAGLTGELFLANKEKQSRSSVTNSLGFAGESLIRTWRTWNLDSVLVFPFVAIREYLTNTGQWMWEVVRNDRNHVVNITKFRKIVQCPMVWFSNQNCCMWNIIVIWTSMRSWKIPLFFGSAFCLLRDPNNVSSWKDGDLKGDRNLVLFLMTFRTKFLKWIWTWKPWSRLPPFSTLIEHNLYNLQAVLFKCGLVDTFSLSHGIHGNGIFTYICHQNQLNVDTYIIYHTWILWLCVSSVIFRVNMLRSCPLFQVQRNALKWWILGGNRGCYEDDLIRMNEKNDPSNVTKEWATEHFDLAEEIKGVWMRMLDNPLKVLHEMDGTKIDNDIHLIIYLHRTIYICIYKIDMYIGSLLKRIDPGYR